MGLLAAIGYQHNWVEVLGATFMRHAFIGGTLVALASGLIGYFVVVRRDAFAAHALAHIGFPGATGAALVGAPVTLGLAVFCVAGGLAIGAFGKRVDRREVATGTVLAFATSLGVLFASMATDSTVSSPSRSRVHGPTCSNPLAHAASNMPANISGIPGSAGRIVPATPNTTSTTAMT